MWLFITSHVDGNWVDICSFISGIFYLVFQKYRPASLCKKPFLSKQTGLDFANGAALFPLLILTLSVLSSEFVRSLMDASRMSLSIAGFFSIMAILEA